MLAQGRSQVAEANRDAAFSLLFRGDEQPIALRNVIDFDADRFGNFDETAGPLRYDELTEFNLICRGLNADETGISGIGIDVRIDQKRGILDVTIYRVIFIVADAARKGRNIALGANLYEMRHVEGGVIKE